MYKQYQKKIFRRLSFFNNLHIDRRRAAVFLVFWWIPFTIAFAHGDRNEVIDRLSCRIEEQPTDALLYFERGLLYKEHGEISPAFRDFYRALFLEPDFDACLLQLSQLYLEWEMPETALLYVNLFIEKKPDNPFAFNTSASAYQMTGEDSFAVGDLRKAIALKNENAIRPDDYLHLSEAILRAFPDNYDGAVAALKEGLARFGDIISIQSRIVDLEVERQCYREALEQVDQIMAPLPRKESWLAKKAATFPPACPRSNYRLSQSDQQRPDGFSFEFF